MHYLYEAFTRLNNLQLKLEKELEILKKRNIREVEGKKNRERSDLEINSIRNSLNNAFIDLAMAVEESRKISEGDISALIALQVLMPIIKKRLDEVKNIEELHDILKMITDPLRPWIEQKRHERISYYDYNHKYRDYWLSQYGQHDSIPVNILNNICNAIKWRHDKVNIFDMFCRSKSLADTFNSDNRKVDIYGLDSAKNIDIFNKNGYRRVIFGELKGCAISNVCFDIVTCIPPVTVNREMRAGSYVKKERDLLFKAIDYLRPDGWLIYSIPYFRFYMEICVHLLKNYHNFQIFADNNEYGAVYVICQKRSIPLQIDDIDKEFYAKLRNMPFNYYDLDRSPSINSIKLPDRALDIKRFRGSELNEEELVEMHNLSKCTATFWKEQQVEKLGNSQARPLLPFNIGQLGLILTSGCLDGIVEEGNGFCHVVKGRVIKKTDTVESVDNRTHQVQIVNTTTNRVEISAFLPDGTYKCLA